MLEFLPLVEDVIAPNLRNALYDYKAGAISSQPPISAPPQPEPLNTLFTLGACVNSDYCYPCAQSLVLFRLNYYVIFCLRPKV